MNPKLIIIETHPIQYKAPLFRRLAAQPQIDLTVLYAMIPDAAQQGAGFGVPFAWDVPLLEGYRYEVMANRASRPSVTEFRGCDTPELFARLRRAAGLPIRSFVAGSFLASGLCGGLAGILSVSYLSGSTTGAGDLYAAGFLFGLTAGRPLAECGKLGSIAAAAVIGHIGPRPGLSLAQMIPLAD